ncbi:hypothetical protein GCM10010245_79560 [Streptomyces spectabilis]|nr:hypothetical protein GCM10010245_79560 [Streptomyces spectabilis]
MRGVPAGAAAEVEDTPSRHLAEGVDAGAACWDSPVPPVQLGQLESSGDLVSAVGVPDFDGVLLDGTESSIGKG